MVPAPSNGRRSGHPGAAMKRWLTLTGAAAIVLAAAACSGTPTSTQASRPHRVAAGRPAASPTIAVVTTSAWWKPDPAPFCDSPALVRVSGRVGPVGDCDGFLIIPPDAMTLRAGQRIDVHILDVSLPRSSDRAVLAQITVSPDGATGTYQALRPGRATLISAAGWQRAASFTEKCRWPQGRDRPGLVGYDHAIYDRVTAMPG
jgi:hypothetical protein